ncbi:hypothetical protein AVEN_176238-1, partial [Araneus ventricosus]
TLKQSSSNHHRDCNSSTRSSSSQGLARSEQASRKDEITVPVVLAHYRAKSYPPASPPRTGVRFRMTRILTKEVSEDEIERVRRRTHLQADFLRKARVFNLR